MIILIDSGNSRLKVGWLDAANPDTPREPAAVAFEGVDLDALDRWLAALPRRPAHALGVNVAGEARGLAIAAILEKHGCAMTWSPSQASTLGLVNSYRVPTQLGADRWSRGRLSACPARIHPSCWPASARPPPSIR